VKAVLIEDQALLRDALTVGLTSKDVTVVGHAQDETGAVRAVDDFAPDIVILDIRLPPGFTDEGVRIAELLRRKYPDVALLVLSSYAELSFAERLLSIEERSRSIGYLLKDRVGDLTQLVDTMRRVVSGEVVIDSNIVDRLIAGRQRNDPVDLLTSHEQRVLALAAEGRSNLGIAQQLGCRISTVEKHLSVITEKLGLPASNDESRPGVNVRVLAAITYLRSHKHPH
jgi:DNA-binding NarL/FixJ family response regulator